MKIIKNILIGISTTFFCVCNAQTDNIGFELFKSKFAEAKTVVNMKRVNDFFQEVELSKEQAIRILHLPENTLKYSDVAYNMDTDEETYYYRETLPKTDFFIPKESIVIFVYHIEYEYEYSDDWKYECYLITTNNIGDIIDKKAITRNREQENQNQHYNAVILNDSTFRIFNYNINDDDCNDNDVLNINDYKTKVNIIEYRIKDDGHIVETGYEEVRYAKEYPQYYTRYREKSDDPMNEY